MARENNDNRTQPSSEGDATWVNDDEALEAVSQDMSPGEGASVLREVARLSLDLKLAKRRAIRVWSALIVLLGMFIATAYWSLALNPKYRYIATNNNEAICEVSTASVPLHTPATIVEFAKEGVVNAYTYDYINYRRHINNSLNKWFSDKGRKAYMRSLDRSNNLKMVMEGRLIIKAYATQVPQLEEEGVMTGSNQKYWEVRVPIMVEFYANGSSVAQTQQTFMAIVTVVQEQSSALNHKGLAIDRINLASGKFDRL